MYLFKVEAAYSFTSPSTNLSPRNFRPSPQPKSVWLKFSFYDKNEQPVDFASHSSGDKTTISSNDNFQLIINRVDSIDGTVKVQAAGKVFQSNAGQLLNKVKVLPSGENYRLTFCRKKKKMIIDIWNINGQIISTQIDSIVFNPGSFSINCEDYYQSNLSNTVGTQIKVPSIR